MNSAIQVFALAAFSSSQVAATALTAESALTAEAALIAEVDLTAESAHYYAEAQLNHSCCHDIGSDGWKDWPFKYVYGRGARRSLATCTTWYKNSAKQGCWGSCYNLDWKKTIFGAESKYPSFYVSY